MRSFLASTIHTVGVVVSVSREGAQAAFDYADGVLDRLFVLVAP